MKRHRDWGSLFFFFFNTIELNAGPPSLTRRNPVDYRPLALGFMDDVYEPNRRVFDAGANPARCPLIGECSCFSDVRDSPLSRSPKWPKADFFLSRNRLTGFGAAPLAEQNTNWPSRLRQVRFHP